MIILVYDGFATSTHSDMIKEIVGVTAQYAIHCDAGPRPVNCPTRPLGLVSLADVHHLAFFTAQVHRAFDTIPVGSHIHLHQQMWLFSSVQFHNTLSDV